MRITMVAILVVAFGAGCGGDPLADMDADALATCQPLTYLAPCPPATNHPLMATCLSGDNTSLDPAKSLPQVNCTSPFRDTKTGEIYAGTCVASCQ